MKRFFSLVLSMLLFFAALAPCYMVIENNNYRKNVSLFCSNVKSLNEKYNELSSIAMRDENGKPVYSAYENRLIVRTDDTLGNLNAIEVVSGLDYKILQYSDSDAMQKDFENLRSSGYTVTKDKVYFVDDVDAASIDNAVSIAYNGYDYGLAGETYAKTMIYSSSREYDDVVVGVLDSGVEYTHELLANRMDIDNGPNFSSSGEQDSSMDDQGHGTMVSGIIVKSTPNNVKIRPYKLANKYGTMTASETICAFEYILAEKNKPDIINMSFGGFDLVDGENEIQNDLVEKLVDSGITVCTSAGNDYAPSECYSPAGCSSSINVSSCDSNGDFSSFSNYGKAIDICAPGEYIYTSTLNNKYTSEHSGTSFSSPFAAAACAYVIMQNPDYTPAQVKDKICSSALYQGNDESYYFGKGLLNFANLIDDKTYDAPKPSVEGGLYHEAQTVTFDVPEGTQLIYSLNPYGPVFLKEKYTLYNEPITIESDSVLHYALIADDKYVSSIESEEYIIQYYTDTSDYTVLAGSITSYNGDKTNIVVPDNINATSVYRSAFENSKVKSIVLPDKITLLGTNCFKNSSLKHITAKGVTKLNGESVFRGCADLRDEVMPKLATVTDSAFMGCAKLHQIDFGDNITKLRTNLFKESGLMYADFPKAEISLLSNDSIFEDAKLLTCNLPKISELGKSFFSGNRLLYDLNCADIEIMRSNCLKNTSSLKYFDVSKVKKLYSNAIAGCWIKNFYAPLVTGFADTGTSFGEYCNCETVNMPNFTAAIGSNAFLRAGVKNIYFEKVTNISSASAFVNTPEIEEMYFPNAKTFYGAKISTPNIYDEVYKLLGVDYNRYPQPEIIWIPKANNVYALKVSDGGLIYAPSATNFEFGSQESISTSVIVLSGLMDTSKLKISNIDGNAFDVMPTVVAPLLSELNTESNIYNFVAVKDCFYKGIYDTELSYICGGISVDIPIDYISSLWQNSMINTSTENSPYEFIFDFTNDKFLNAKDYSYLINNI